MPRPRNGEIREETRRVMIRMPVWMLNQLYAKAAEEESDVSKLIRLAVRRAFFIAEPGTIRHDNMRDTTNEARQ